MHPARLTSAISRRPAAVTARRTIALLVLALAACGSATNGSDDASATYCDAHPEDTEQCSLPDAAGGCTTDDQCPGEACDVASASCVTCTASHAEACGDTTPVCGPDHTCVSCTTHDDCATSNVCLPSGACAAEALVAYVSAGGTGTTCSQTSPCPLLATAVAKNRPFIMVAADGAVSDTSAVTIESKVVSIFAAAGASVSRASIGAVIEVKGAGADVRIYDLQIHGARAPLGGAHGIILHGAGAPRLTLRRVKMFDNAGFAIYATGGALDLAQSTFFENAGGAILVDTGQFSIVGNWFYRNGSRDSGLGGVMISAPANAANRLEFNSFHRNGSQNNTGTAIRCYVAGFTARNNLMSDNGTETNALQTEGTCGHAYSVARPGPVPAGPGNSAADPRFVSPFTGDLHISPTSPARGMADPNSNLLGEAAFDRDGDPRTNPADIGADEVP